MKALNISSLVQIRRNLFPISRAKFLNELSKLLIFFSVPVSFVVLWIHIACLKLINMLLKRELFLEWIFSSWKLFLKQVIRIYSWFFLTFGIFLSVESFIVNKLLSILNFGRVNLLCGKLLSVQIIWCFNCVSSVLLGTLSKRVIYVKLKFACV